MVNKSLTAETVPNGFINDILGIVKRGRLQAYAAVNQSMISTYWHIGERIVEEEQNGHNRADYGKAIINTLSESLTLEFGEGFSPRYLRAFRQFYLVVPSYEIWKSRFPDDNSQYAESASEILKSPVIAEFLGLSPDCKHNDIANHSIFVSNEKYYITLQINQSHLYT